jgi:hypothetical protein
MTKITKDFTREFHSTIRSEINKLAEKYGIQLSFSKATYNSHVISIRAELRPIRSPEERAKRAQISIVPGLQFHMRGKRYEVTGFLPNRRKYSVEIRSLYNGRTYATTRESIRDSIES